MRHIVVNTEKIISALRADGKDAAADAMMFPYTCPECQGEGQVEGWNGRQRECYTCRGEKTLPAIDLGDIIARVEGRKTGTLRSKAPDHYGDACQQSRRAYYVWRMARFHGGADMTMPMTAISAIERNDPARDLLDITADAVAKACFGSHMRGAQVWGRALGFD